MGSGWFVNAYSSHSIHGGGVCVCREWFKPTKPRGLELGMQGDGSTTKPDMIMDVGL